jgi:hypothetical protein
VSRRGLRFRVKGIASWHDQENGKKRGPNIIYCRIDGVRVAHMVRHRASLDKTHCRNSPGRRIAEPVGGHFTIDSSEAADMAHKSSRASPCRCITRRRVGFPIADEKACLQRGMQISRLNEMTRRKCGLRLGDDYE